MDAHTIPPEVIVPLPSYLEELPPEKEKYIQEDRLKDFKEFKKFPRLSYTPDPNAPKDKYNFVLIILAVFGLVHILPFTFFLTANEYWMYKFRNTTSNSTDANDRTFLQTNFASLHTMTTTGPSVICNLALTFFGHKIRAKTRVLVTLTIHSFVFAVQTAFVGINTDDWQVEFFWITMGTMLFMSCSMSFGGAGLMNLVSKLPPKYMKSYLIGEGGAGLFTAIMRVVSIVSSPSTTGSALIYFLTGTILISVTSIIFYFSTKTPFFRHYTFSCKAEAKEKIRQPSEILEVLKLVWPMLILNAIGMLIPVSAITSLVVSEYYGTDSVWGNKYFITVCTYLLPAVFGLIGRGIFNGLDINVSIPVLYGVVISSHIIFDSLLYLSNAKPRHHLPVVIAHDWQYGMLTSVHALSSGFIMNMSMIKTMRMVPPKRLEMSMMIVMGFMGICMAATSPLGVLAVKLL